MTKIILPRFLAAAAAAVLLCCAGAGKPLNVIVVGIDTLRADHLSCYGYERKTTPNIDRLAAGGALFLDDVSQAPWTLPSFASLFTSLYPHQHGVTSGLTQVKDTFPTLASTLLEKGYSTGAIINSRVLDPEMKLDRGFQFYDRLGPNTRLADGTTRDGLAWIDKQKGKPFLLFLHYFDPHEPYAPPAPYDTLYYPEYSGGKFGHAFHFWKEFPEAAALNFKVLESNTPEDWAHIVALYDGEITFTDAAIGDLLKGLESRGLTKRTLIVVTADHGEEFYDHKGFGHGHSLFAELLRVPLIFSLPGRIAPNQRLSEQVRAIDMMPTVLDILGIKSQARFEGASLLPMLEGKGRVVAGQGSAFPPSLAYSEGILHGDPKVSLTAQPWKVICDLAGNREMFFNVADDPKEQHEIADRSSDAYLSLSAVLLRSVFETSDTWYIAMGSGTEPHDFGVAISAENGPLTGTFQLWRLMDRKNSFLPADAWSSEAASNTRLVLRNLRPDSLYTLAFKVNAPPGLLLGFDLTIDGKPAADRTLIGESGQKPAGMPFTRRVAQRAQKSWGEPKQKPPAPYFLVWRAPGRSVSETGATLTEDAKHELRALGYLQ